MEINKTYHIENKITLIHGLAQDFITTLPDESVTLVVTSPPYNIGKKYEQKFSLDSYLEEFAQIIGLMTPKIAANGNICWQVGSYVKNGEVFPLDIFYYQIFKDLGYQLRNRIVWHYGHGLHARQRFSGRYETILWFTKSKNYVFNLDPVRVPAKYPGKRHYRGSKKGKPSGNPKGKNPTDYWEYLEADWQTGVWDIPNVKARHIEKTSHPCQFPIALVERCVLALSNEGDLVFDPLAGAGSTLIAAIKNNRRALGCEKEGEYVDIATTRIKSFLGGSLKIRELEKPVYTPTANEKVAQVPQEWLETDEGSIYSDESDK